MQRSLAALPHGMCSYKQANRPEPRHRNGAGRFGPVCFDFRQHRTIPALRLKHRFGGCGTASALPKCSIMSGCGTRIVLRGQKPLALCDRCPCFGSLFPPLAALTFAASSIICAFGLASAVPRSPYRHLELCGIAFTQILPYAVYDMKYLTNRLRRIFCLFGGTGSIIKAP